MRENRTLWELLDRLNRTTLGKWVRLPLRVNVDVEGVIPRAARQLFSKLAAENTERATHSARTASGSGIRPPSRLSMQLSPVPAGIKPKMHKIVPSNKDWSLKATYVEVHINKRVSNHRFTMMNCAIFFSHPNFETRNASPSPSEKIKAQSF